MKQPACKFYMGVPQDEHFAWQLHLATEMVDTKRDVTWMIAVGYTPWDYLALTTPELKL